MKRIFIILLVVLITLLIVFVGYTTYVKTLFTSMKIDKVYVINLDRTPERMLPLKQQLEIIETPFERFSAIDGYKLVLKDIESGEEIKGTDLKRIPSPLTRNHQYKLLYPDSKIDVNYYFAPKTFPLTAGELGVAMSHMSIWHDMLENNYQAVMIFEDDACLRIHFDPKIKKILENAPKDWDMIYLGSQTQPDTKTQKFAGNELLEKVTKGGLILAHAYIISNKAAKKFYSKHQKLIFPIDEDLKDPEINVYRTRSELVGQRYQPSLISDMGR
jgi:GR25 family glycosyltransferase involved in LPS biosynthesis